MDRASLETRPVVLRSVLLSRIGVPHAFSTRVGGVSTGMFASLNFGNPGDLPPEQRDPVGNIRENQRRVLESIGASGREIVEVWQVHGDAVVVRRGGVAVASDSDVKADAIVTDDPSCVAAVRTADCAPILLASPDGRVVGAVHAGWRGMIAGVLPAAIKAMRELGASELCGAIGPCITVDAFEVGEEVAREVDRAFGAGAGLVRRDLGAKPHVDLKGALRLQMLSAGLGEKQIETLPHCTVRNAKLFYSHRRDAGTTGRMSAFIGAAQK